LRLCTLAIFEVYWPTGSSVACLIYVVE